MNDIKLKIQTPDLGRAMAAMKRLEAAFAGVGIPPEVQCFFDTPHRRWAPLSLTRRLQASAERRIAEVGAMTAEGVSEVVSSYETLRADSERGTSMDSENLDRLFAEIDSLTKGD